MCRMVDFVLCCAPGVFLEDCRFDVEDGRCCMACGECSLVSGVWSGEWDDVACSRRILFVVLGCAMFVAGGPVCGSGASGR